MDRIDQDVMVERICSLFADAKVVDRRATPSHGYRAVHVIVSTEGRLVEVQVRTELQHLWAQTMERVADASGRGIRYGDYPEEPNGRLTQAVHNIVGVLIDLAGEIVKTCGSESSADYAAAS